MITSLLINRHHHGYSMHGLGVQAPGLLVRSGMQARAAAMHVDHAKNHTVPMGCAGSRAAGASGNAATAPAPAWQQAESATPTCAGLCVQQAESATPTCAGLCVQVFVQQAESATPTCAGL